MYHDYPLAQFGPVGACFPHHDYLLELKNVIHTPYIYVGFYVNEDQIILYPMFRNKITNKTPNRVFLGN